jgi:hypothetical protein
MEGLAGQVALVVILALASFSVQEMKPGAGGAFIFVFLERHRLRPSNVGRSSMSSGR